MSTHTLIMDEQGREFWQNSIKQSPYMLIGILFSALMLMWRPALPYLYLGALAAILHFVIELVFYRKAQSLFFGVYLFLIMFLKGRAEDLYPVKGEPFFTEILLLLMFIGVYFGVRGLLHLIFRRVIVSRVGLDAMQNTS